MRSELTPSNRISDDLFSSTLLSFLRPVLLHGEQRLLPLEVWEADEVFVIRAEVPGLDPEKIEVTLDGDTLTIKGERERPSNLEGKLRVGKLPYGAFQRTVTFATPLAGGEVDAQATNGVLTIRIPKAEEARPRRIEIKNAGE